MSSGITRNASEIVLFTLYILNKILYKQDSEQNMY